MIEWHKKVTKKIIKLVGISKYRYMLLTFAKASPLA